MCVFVGNTELGITIGLVFKSKLDTKDSRGSKTIVPTRVKCKKKSAHDTF